MYTVYGIPACNSVKKAINWFKEQNIPFQFHDYKKEGITIEKLRQWNEQTGFEKLLNTKGTTWRGLDEAAKATAANESGALALMAEKTSIIKRPVVEQDGKVVAVGLDAAFFTGLAAK